MVINASDTLIESPELVVDPALQKAFDLSKERLIALIERQSDKSLQKRVSSVRRQVKETGCPFSFREVKRMNQPDQKAAIYGVAGGLQDDVVKYFLAKGWFSLYTNHDFDTNKLLRYSEIETDDVWALSRLNEVLQRLIVDLTYMTFHRSHIKEGWYDHFAIGSGDEESKDLVDKAARKKLTHQRSNEFPIFGGFANFVKNYYGVMSTVPLVFYKQFGREITYEEFIEIFDSLPVLFGMLARLHHDTMIAFERAKSPKTLRAGSLGILVDNPGAYVIGKDQNGSLAVMPSESSVVAMYKGKTNDMPTIGCPYGGICAQFHQFIRPNILKVFEGFSDPEKSREYLSEVFGSLSANL